MMNFLSQRLVITLFLVSALCVQCMSSTFGKSRGTQYTVHSINKFSGRVQEFSENESGSDASFHDGPRGKWQSPGTSGLRRHALEGRLMDAIRTTFLPTGFPTQTRSGYLRYCIFSWIQDLSTQLRSVLATQRILEGVGVGRKGATALSALLNYLIRDGCGMMATLLFTYCSSSNFRSDVKRWRLFADMVLDVGITLEVLAIVGPPALFLPMISVGSMCKAMCGVAAGACGGSIAIHWAQGTDISDINAKFGAQQTLTGACGLILAALFARSLDDVNAWFLWICYTLLTAVHIFANVRCMRLIEFDHLNTNRLRILIRDFYIRRGAMKIADGSEAKTVLLKPQDVARVEPLFFVGTATELHDKDTLPIDFGVSFNRLMLASRSTPKDLLTAKSHFDKYVVASDLRRINAPRVCVSLLFGATREQEAKAYFHAYTLAKVLLGDNPTTLNPLDVRQKESQIEDLVDGSWHQFYNSSTDAGWDMGKMELSSEGYEIRLVGVKDD